MTHDRRRFLTVCSSLGLGSTLFPGLLYGMAQEQARITQEMIEQAEKLAGLEFDDAQRKVLEQRLNRKLSGYSRLREYSLPNAVPPAVHFDPRPEGFVPKAFDHVAPRAPELLIDDLPNDLEELAVLPVTHLAEYVRQEVVTSTELTEMYLARLKRYDKKLHCVITLTEELALEQAAIADEEIADGHYRGPLHGIPWGAKDLLNTKGIRTTYGAKPFEEQILDDDATVVTRLRDAGAVLLGKLTLGALAMGDVWFGGKTRNPWNLEQGSSGSSAGPGAATAAGLVGFSIGTETLGSIVSPSTRCGVSGLRPTYGRVSRAGAMALSWTMDKIGPMCRSAEDCALVLQAIAGRDDRDVTAADVPFSWDPDHALKGLKIGYLASAFESRRTSDRDKASLEVVRELGPDDLIPIELPDYPASSMMTILDVEAGTAFDEITRNGQVDELVRQDPGAWPTTFRTAQFVPAVEYLRANRVRSLLIRDMAKVMEKVDVFVSPAFGGSTLQVTNLTGHPCLCLPNGFQRNGSPTSITFIGRLYAEADLVAVGKAYQSRTDFHLQHPDLDAS